MTHLGTYSHTCEYCGKGVRKIEKLREHKKVNHPELYALEMKEAEDKKLNEEEEIKRKLETGELVPKQRVSLTDFDISDIIDRVTTDARKSTQDTTISMGSWK